MFRSPHRYFHVCCIIPYDHARACVAKAHVFVSKWRQFFRAQPFQGTSSISRTYHSADRRLMCVCIVSSLGTSMSGTFGAITAACLTPYPAARAPRPAETLDWTQSVSRRGRLAQLYGRLRERVLPFAFAGMTCCLVDYRSLLAQSNLFNRPRRALMSSAGCR